MKILLFGEFSGLHSNLKDGLIELGHDVTIAAGRDGYKQIPCDINLDGTLPGGFGKIETRLKPFVNIPRLSGHDIVQTINPFFPNAKYFPKKLLYSILSKRNERFFILATGNDAFYWRHGREKLRYGPFEDFLKYDVKTVKYYMDTEDAYKYNKSIIELADGVIPSLYEYEVGYRSCGKRLNTLPLPLNTNSISYSENRVNSKLVIFHGLSRYGFKGTRHVEEAFDYLKKKYPNELELIIEGQLPLEKYLPLMKRANVVIDQLYSYSNGMNALYALAMGKIVLGGAEPESLESLAVKKTPVINLEPNKQSIINSVEKLIEQRDSIPEMSFKCRKFVEDVHDHVKVAQKYIDTWKST